MRYRLIAIDIDGTLLDSKGRVSARNIEAIRAAQAAGVLVVPCTGRAWRETSMFLSAFPVGKPADGLGVFVGGAAVSDLTTGRSLDIAVLEPHLVHEMVRHLYDGELAIVILREPSIAGHDYMVTGRGTLNASSEWWFQTTRSTVLFHADPTPDDLHHVLRVALVTQPDIMDGVMASLRERFGKRVLLQSFTAVQMPRSKDSVQLLEIFARGVDKWRGLSWIAEQRGIRTDEVAVIGDEVNDLAMVSAAGCGIAMGNAIDAVKSAADHVTLHCDEAGVAHAIERLMSGAWG